MAVVPAAGRSHRMGHPKPLLALGGETFLERVATALTGGGARRVVVVVAPDAPQIARLARRLRLEVAVNPEPERGMLSSILSGLAAVRETADAGADPFAADPLLVCPADLPALSAATVAAVLAALGRPGAGLALPVVGDRRGHPLAIAPDLLAEIADLDPEVGLKQLLERHPERLVEVPVDDAGAIRDVDTPEDYRRLLAQTEAPKVR